MKSAVPAEILHECSRELDSIASSLIKIRILHYASGERIADAAILERLRQHGCAISGSKLNPMLAKILRNGWLESNASPARGSRNAREYSLTRQGHRTLTVAQQQLKQLIAKWVTT